MAGVRTWLLWPLLWVQTLRGLLFGWVPVCISVGIGLWFALEAEPSVPAYGLVAVGLGLAVAAYRFGPELGQPVAVVLACGLAGFLAAGARAHLVAAPMLERPYAGPVQGRIIEIDRSQSDALRLTLDEVVLNLAPEKTPARVRVSLQGEVPVPDPGQTVLVTARLAAPEGPTEPGGFDFRRMAFFDGLGAVGYSRTPVVIWQDPAPGVQLVNRFRMHLSRAIMSAAPGDAGAFASGAMTGDRSGISKATVEALRDSNLAHLLAISGMNMAFLTGFVFMLLRYGLALWPAFALRVNTKKLAAFVAFGVALFYLLLSGANVATERAFLMVTVMLGAVLFDRRALTMRSVALSAILLLLWQPESLSEPGFQLSFAATVALIAGFGALEGQVLRERLPRWVIPLFTLVLSSVLAGLATAPFAAAHFNRFTDYGLVANLMTVPMMSVLMAAGVVAALLAPLGLAAPALWVMELAARWILFVAHWVAGLDGAVTPIIAPGPLVIPLVAFAGCWLVLMRGRTRALSALPLILGLGLWAGADRPAVLISGDGRLVGIMGPLGRSLSAEKGAGFVAEAWLEKDGDLAPQAEAAARGGFQGAKGQRSFVLNAGMHADSAAPVAGSAPASGPIRVMILSGQDPGLEAACASADLLILAEYAKGPSPAGCRVIDRKLLSRTGALALSPTSDGWQILPAKRSSRIWAGAEPIPALPTLRPVEQAARALSNSGSAPPAGLAP